jgi:beta-lactamase class A
MMSRRELLAGSVLAGVGLMIPPVWADSDPIQAIVALEKKHGGRLGVALFDTGTNRLITYRGDERFALCSTFKLLAVAFVLSRVDRGQEDLSRRIVYRKSDLVSYSPITETHVDDGMTVAALCKAALTLSDNTAANLLLASFGGPQALTSYLRSIGDIVTRLDRTEPDLNDVVPGDMRDTTSPAAMLQTMQTLLLGNALSAASRAQLIAWLVANKTGDKRLRAGLPKDWRIGDKTGSGAHGETNDVAIIWPPERAPIIVTVYYADSNAPEYERNAVLSELGRIVLEFMK